MIVHSVPVRWEGISKLPTTTIDARSTSDSSAVKLPILHLLANSRYPHQVQVASRVWIGE